jgi:hypothetical protein
MLHGAKICARSTAFSSLFHAFPPCGRLLRLAGHAILSQRREKQMRWITGTVLAAGVLMLAAAGLAAPARQPGFVLADTYPDTGGRAPVAPGGKVLPPGSPGSGVMANC